VSDSPKPAKRTAAKNKTYDGFTDEERSAMKQRAQEMKAASRRGSGTDEAEVEAEVLAKIAEMKGDDRAMAEWVHAIVKASAPGLSPRLWYGMPAYAKAGKVVCFFQPAEKFKARYSTLGFNDPANLDDGTMWPIAYALTEMNAADKARIGELVRKAAS
jgi:uncharacterized protein YdhG (YjbR/CyaY superfamily)